MDDLYPVSFNKVMQAQHYTIFVLEVEKKNFAIYAAHEVGNTVERILSGTASPRPQTHDLLNSILKGLDITPLQLILHDLKETIYFSKFFLTQIQDNEQKILEIDTRPSDGLILALSYNLPIFCTKNLLDKLPEFIE